MSGDEDKKKQVIGLYGEMQLAMILHERGWQVHRSYIDEGIDFVITKYFCRNCGKFSVQYIRKQKYKGSNKKCTTNLCNTCKKDSLILITKYLQIKTSEGIVLSGDQNTRDFSFHPKIRYNIDKNVYYVWIAVFSDSFEKESEIKNAITHYYIFNTKEVSKFDDISLDTYQITDNQKTTLKISIDGTILNRGIKYSYECFKEFHNNFKELDKIK
jgi:hypothetical protein